ncbi:MAG: hypothetical protein EHM33_01880 [Chloroflexi bacterium]|nr:MAG: hypothetical protein EHM33_01880 [Chloroflexota bacterium]
MITKVEARKILEETCGEYIAIDDELAARVADGFNEILATQRSQTTHEADTGQPCPSCGGDGLNHDPSTSPIYCDVCNGTGQG